MMLSELIAHLEKIKAERGDKEVFRPLREYGWMKLKEASEFVTFGHSTNKGEMTKDYLLIEGISFDRRPAMKDEVVDINGSGANSS